MKGSLGSLVVVSMSVLLEGCTVSDPPEESVRPRPAHRPAREQQAAAQQLGLPVVETNSIGMELVLIPPGEFWMGSSETDQYGREDERPPHRVRITHAFYLGVCEVSVGEFRQFVELGGYTTEAESDGRGGFGWDGEELVEKPEYTWRNAGFPQTDQHPVLNVSWNDAMVFCRWLTQREARPYRLPTEAQWEYACRAGSRTRYSFGYDERGMAEHGWCADNSSVRSHPVGAKRANAWGLYDMHGNAYEWCSDCYGPYAESPAPVDDPVGPGIGVYRVYRGGCWHAPASQCRSALRLKSQPRNRSSSLGFRVVCEVDSALPPKGNLE